MSEKVEVILAGAMQEFLQHGYAATSMDQVAAVAGVSKATVYRHFQDKEGLFSALIQHLAQEKSLFTIACFEALHEPPGKVLKQWAIAMLDNVANDPQLLTFFRLMIAESGRFPSLARAVVQNIEKPTIDRLTQFLSDHPDLHLADPEVAARMFIGTLVHTIILHELLHGRDLVPIERDRLIDQLIQFITGNRE